jgi:hypothetical protein
MQHCSRQAVQDIPVDRLFKGKRERCTQYSIYARDDQFTVSSTSNATAFIDVFDSWRPCITGAAVLRLLAQSPATCTVTPGTAT